MQILAVILIGIAAFFLWRGKSDAGFVTAVLACASFLISTRFPVKERVEQQNAKILQKRLEEEQFSPEKNIPVIESEERDLTE